MNFNHLTDEQFAELLAGNKSDTCAVLHVENCAACRDELSSLGAAVGDLNFASMRWAERRASRIETPSSWALNWNALPLGATVAGVLMFGVAIGAHMQTSNQIEPALRPAHALSAPSDDVVAQDNSLMRSIDNELAERIGPQVSASDLDVTSRAPHRRLIHEVNYEEVN